MPVHVLFEDNHLLAVSKPAGLPTMGARQGEPSLIIAAKDYIKRTCNKLGNVYLGVVSRLDAPVTGIVLFARTSKAAARLNRMFQEGRIRKLYWAVVEGVPKPPAGECLDWLRKNQSQRQMEICDAGAAGSRQARLAYRLLQRLPRGALIEVELFTGRKHQIRVQLAHRGWPVAGDTKYGGRLRFAPGIALHARALEFVHPVKNTPIRLLCPVPESWRTFGLPEGLGER